MVARRLAEYWVAETGAVRGVLRAPRANIEQIIEEMPLDDNSLQRSLVRPRWLNATDFRERYYRGGYEAHVLLVDGQVELMRTAEAAETAPPPAGAR